MTRVRLQLTAILMVAYFGFLLLGAFAQPTLAVPVYGPVPLSFVLGLLLIIGSIALTGLYALAANRDDAQ
jgi:uncharacterized membrane protein (DUF485 family)